MDKTVNGFRNNLSVLEIFGWVFAGAAIGLILLNVPLIFALVVAGGLVVLAITITRPEIGLLSIVVLISSIVFEENLGLIPIGVGSLHTADVMFLFLVSIIIYQRMTREDFNLIKTPLDKWLLLFFATLAISAFIAMHFYGVDFNHVMRQARHLSYYLLFFIVTTLITSKKQIQFVIKGLFVIALIVAVTMLAQAIVGESIQLMPGRIETARIFGRAYGATRILPPGQTLVFVMFITSVCFLTMFSESSIFRSKYFYMILTLSIGILLTYNRNYWIAALMCLAILLFLLSAERKSRLIAMLLVVVMMSSMIVLISGESNGKFNQTVRSISDRFTSLFAGEELLSSKSLEIRHNENKYAIAQIAKHPVLGIGLGNTYRPAFWRNDELTYYMENGYLWIMTDMGITGLLFFLLFYIGFLLRAFRNWKLIEDKFFRSALVGFMLSGIGILPMVIVNPIFMQWFSIVVIAIMAGLSENIIRLNTAESEPSTS